MKALLTTAALAIALAAPAAEARVAHHKTAQATSGAMVKTGAKKAAKAKHKKHGKKKVSKNA